MPSVTLTQQGIQRTVKHYKAFFISEKPDFLSKTFNFILIICIANSVPKFEVTAAKYFASVNYQSGNG